jgi:hypothetical protein
MRRNGTSDRNALVKSADDPIRCSRCGTIGYRGDSFCPCCGETLVQHCTACGASVLHPIARFCTRCGAALGEDERRIR